MAQRVGIAANWRQCRAAVVLAVIYGTPRGARRPDGRIGRDQFMSLARRWDGDCAGAQFTPRFVCLDRGIRGVIGDRVLRSAAQNPAEELACGVILVWIPLGAAAVVNILKHKIAKRSETVIMKL